ncbi:MAG: glycoside hydrolase family 13 protein, partial [Chlorobia bacterium]|nr:glycoside hydrolase family 13 protein [Fimbriimonadaceae bacterium]
IDGWRLDVAFELGDQALLGIRQAAHEAKPGSLVVGEINGYPADWFHCVDGVFNFYTMNLAIRMAKGEISSGQFGQMLRDLVQDAGIENLMRSWLVTDNHDTDRLASLLKDPKQRRIVQALQFTLPGSPVVYNGSELGMEGVGDPANRAPMRWDLVSKTNADLNWVEKLIRIRKRQIALRYGDLRILSTDKLLGFTRITDKVAETTVVIVNPTDTVQTETTSIRAGKIMSWGELKDELSSARVRSVNGVVQVKLAPHSVMILTPVVDRSPGYSPYDRIR